MCDSYCGLCSSLQIAVQMLQTVVFRKMNARVSSTGRCLQGFMDRMVVPDVQFLHTFSASATSMGH